MIFRALAALFVLAAVIAIAALAQQQRPGLAALFALLLTVTSFCLGRTKQ